MKEQFVTYEIAKILKDLGFDEPCLGIYNGMQEIYCDSKVEHFTSQEKVQYIFGNDKVNVILAPLWQQSIEFIYKKSNIVISRNIYNSGYNIQYHNDDVEFCEWEDTLEKSILKSIEIIKK